MELIERGNLFELFKENEFFRTRTGATIVAKSVIDSAPTVDAVPVVHGKWKLIHIGHGYLWECNVCNKKEIRASDYCPNCGAKMDEVSE